MQALTVGTRPHDYGRGEPEALFSRIAADGFEAVMLAFQKAIEGITSYHEVTAACEQRVSAALADNGIAMNTLGVYMELGMVDETQRKAAVSQFLAGLHVAAAMGIPNVSTETTPLHKQAAGVSREMAMPCLLRSLEELLPTAEELGINICLEPVFYHTLGSAKMAHDIIRDIGSERLRITLDPVNLLDIPDFPRQYALWDEAFELLGEKISLIHIKGIKAVDGTLQKATLEDSVVDYPYMFKQIKALNRPLHIIREETNPETARADVAQLKALCNG